jgi:uncharacterized protein (DUF608 family)
VAGPFDPADFERLVPPDKKLSPAWLRSLTARGEATANRGPELSKIGMPVGGIGCGQLYLGGDGRLWLWDLFNQPPPPDFGDYRGPHYAKPLAPESPFEQGFALAVGPADRAMVRPLDTRGFREITFRGEYPVGHVEYRDADCPVEVALEAFSPFIPLEVDDSSLPLTVMEFTLTNPGRATVEVAVAGWLENAACLGSGRPGRGERHNAFRTERGLRFLDCRAHAAPPEPTRERRPDLLYDDFERTTYERWTASGTAFGRGPVEADRMPEYQGKIGAQGRHLVNTHAAAPGSEVGARDAAQGTLTSEPFVIKRDYINFLIGGGAHKGRTCVNLVVDGQPVLTATGESDNRLKPRSWDVRPWAGRTARLQVVDAESGPWGNIGLDEIVFSDTPRAAQPPLEQEEDFGNLGLALLGTSGADFGRAQLPDGPPATAAFPVGRGDLPASRRSGARPDEGARLPFGRRLTGSLGRRFKLRPGRSARVTFLVCWFFPAVRRGALAHVTGIAGLRRAYANRFGSALEVARYSARNLPRLAADTRLWRRTWYDDSTLPHWFLERTFLNVSTLATATCHQFDNRRFYGWEGTYCCAGTCQHVWQYAQAVGRVFPALERAAREFVDYGLAFHGDTGAMDYRAEAHKVVAIDGQAGTILRTYREHLMSADDGFLRRLWPRIRKSVEHLIARDRDEDGILDGEQYNTLDASWYGEIAWLSSLYCAAVRAGAAMARETGDTAFADRCEAIADLGARRMTERLFDGEYYLQRVDPAHPESINTNDGCHIDQVFGQSWAFQVGLPRVLPEEATRRALEALWRYNVTPDVGTYREGFKTLPGGRWYAMPGEGGLLMCTWPKGGAERAAGKGDATFVGYFNECMTGFEYQVAAHMIWEGLVEKGLAVTRLIHDRYHASRRNPFNEVECSSHYARAMASHGVYLAACGFHYHGPRGDLGFAPRLTPENFRCAFIGAEGWGTFAQTLQNGTGRATIDLRWGRLRLASLALEVEAAAAPVRVSHRGRELPVTVRRQGRRLEIDLGTALVLEAGDPLEVAWRPG